MRKLTTIQPIPKQSRDSVGKRAPYGRFGLVLMVTRACNLRCAYCYAGKKTTQTMEPQLGRMAIDKAVRSLRPGGTLELGFFGGEPLLVAQQVAGLIEHARKRTAEADARLEMSMTTNGTIAEGAAWDVMTAPDVQLSISHDGLPEVHDCYRRTPDGGGSSAEVLATINRLLAAGRDICVSMVVRPDTVARMPDGIAFLQQHGVRRIQPTLDLWTHWDRQAADHLRTAIAQTAELWYRGLPEHSISWFDEKAAKLCGLTIGPTARCGFGDGEVAVSPEGHLYPCERLIGDGGPDDPMRLPCDAADGDDFLSVPGPAASESPCGSCQIESDCNTFCRCSNYVRTGDVNRPDGLLCLWNQACREETARILEKMAMPDE
ncbi:MAG: radical SAM protein [Pirellulales bacterium]|nr:radical SAM protein [Pirellulales bacterium]